MYQFMFNSDVPALTETDFVKACNRFLDDNEDIDLEAIASVNEMDSVSIQDLVLEYYFKKNPDSTYSWKNDEHAEIFTELCESESAEESLYDMMSSDYYDMVTDWLPDGYDTNDPAAIDDAIDEYLFDKMMDED